MFFKYQDGHNTQELLCLIDKLIKHQELILGVYLMISFAK